MFLLFCKLFGGAGADSYVPEVFSAQSVFNKHVVDLGKLHWLNLKIQIILRQGQWFKSDRIFKIQVLYYDKGENTTFVDMEVDDKEKLGVSFFHHLLKNIFLNVYCISGTFPSIHTKSLLDAQQHGISNQQNTRKKLKFMIGYSVSNSIISYFQMIFIKARLNSKNCQEVNKNTIISSLYIM